MLHTRSKPGAMELVAEGIWNGKHGSISVQVQPAGPPKKDIARADKNLQATTALTWEGAKEEGDQDHDFTAHPAHEALCSQVFLRLDAGALAEPSYSDTPQPEMDLSGAGLASVLADLALTRPEIYTRIEEALRAVVPSVRRVRLARAQVTRSEREVITVDNEKISRSVRRKYWGHQVIFDMLAGEGIPAHAASEGTLLVLGLITALMGPARPRLILLDDIDRGLHPQAQRELVTRLRALLETSPDLQIVATSHSPYFLAQLEPAEVRIVTLRDDDGTAVCAAMTEHPEFERWRALMDPGEMWSVMGEEWVKAKRA